MVDTGSEGSCQAEGGTRGTPEAANKYWQAKWCAALTVTEAKTWECEEFSEGMKQDFQLASK